MKTIIQAISKINLEETINSIQEICGLGMVNRIFEVEGSKGTYIFRLNEEAVKRIEYRKEKWCLEQVSALGVPSPKVLKMGLQGNVSFMIQEKIIGQNGRYCTAEEKQEIWEKLGTYAVKYHTIHRIADPEVEAQEFHKDWLARLTYNLAELHDKDSLLHNKILLQSEQKRIKAILSKLKDIKFNVGLVHGDLSPRNVIWLNGEVHLLDWGTAEINVVPHHEIGLVMMSNEASEEDFTSFLKGLGISFLQYQLMKDEIKRLNLLHTLDKYRWAESYDAENIHEYGAKVRMALESIK